MPKNRVIALIILGVILIGGTAILIISRQSGQTQPKPTFIKEGTLEFLSKTDQSLIKQIDLEIADNDADRTQGLMWRKEMEDSQGMLFTFNSMGPQSFWMKNTYLSLDILFVDNRAKIVNIAKNVTPLNENQVRSGVNAQYVVEVNAGFCDRFGISKGDYIKVTPL